MLPPAAQMSLNAMKNAATGVSSYFIIHGREPRLLLEASMDQEPSENMTPLEYARALVSRLPRVYNEIKQRLTEATVKMTAPEDVGDGDNRFNIGDFVLIRRPVRRNKLESVWAGPFVIEKKINERVFEARNLLSDESLTAHMSRIVSYDDSLLNKNVLQKMYRAELSTQDFVVEKIKDHELSFLVHWFGFEDAEDTWEPASAVAHLDATKRYCQEHGIQLEHYV